MGPAAGPMVGPFRGRKETLVAERKWLDVILMAQFRRKRAVDIRPWNAGWIHEDVTPRLREFTRIAPSGSGLEVSC